MSPPEYGSRRPQRANRASLASRANHDKKLKIITHYEASIKNGALQKT